MRRKRTRERLLEAAWRRLERGDPARLEDVAADAGVSRQALYLHFGSRAGLLLALVAHIDETLGLGERIAKVEAIADPIARLEATLGLVTDFEKEIHAVAMALNRLALTDAEVRTAFEDRMAERRRALRACLEPLEAAGRLRPEWRLEEAVDLLWEISAPSSYEHLVIERGWSPKRFRDWLVWAARSLLR